MPQFRIAEAAELLDVSDDTVRRLVDSGKLPSERDQSNVKVISGTALAAFARDRARPAPDRRSQVTRSARNQFVGLVTDVTSGPVITQIEIQCGPHRVVSLMSTEAARDLALTPGILAVAVVKSTHVVVETVASKTHTIPAQDNETP